MPCLLPVNLLYELYLSHDLNWSYDVSPFSSFVFAICVVHLCVFVFQYFFFPLLERAMSHFTPHPIIFSVVYTCKTVCLNQVVMSYHHYISRCYCTAGWRRPQHVFPSIFCPLYVPSYDVLCINHFPWHKLWPFTHGRPPIMQLVSITSEHVVRIYLVIWFLKSSELKRVNFHTCALLHLLLFLIWVVLEGELIWATLHNV